MLKKVRAILGLLMLITIVFSGCTGLGQKSRLTQNWGKSFAQEKSNQILNPEASKNLEPVEGFNGQAGERVMAGYLDSFSAPKEAQSYTINLGSVAGVGPAKP